MRKRHSTFMSQKLGPPSTVTRHQVFTRAAKPRDWKTLSTGIALRQLAIAGFCCVGHALVGTWDIPGRITGTVFMDIFSWSIALSLLASSDCERAISSHHSEDNGRCGDGHLLITLEHSVDELQCEVATSASRHYITVTSIGTWSSVLFGHWSIECQSVAFYYTTSLPTLVRREDDQYGRPLYLLRPTHDQQERLSFKSFFTHTNGFELCAPASSAACFHPVPSSSTSSWSSPTSSSPVIARRKA